MRVNHKLLPVMLLPFTLLVGCGGGGLDELNGPSATTGGVEEETESENNGGSGDTEDTNSGTTAGPAEGEAVGSLPFLVFEPYDDWSGLENNNLYRSGVRYPLIKRYIINPVDLGTLQPIDTAVASDFTTTVNGVPLTEAESFPMLQKVIGIEPELITALVFDISDSMSHANMQALVDEAKAFIAQAQLSSNEMIAAQRFTVWVFGDTVQEVTSGFTSDSAQLESALDGVMAAYISKAQGSGSNIHGAILRAVGRYQTAGQRIDFRDVDGGVENDLFDRVFTGPELDTVRTGQLVMFSSGRESTHEFGSDLMVRAIESQQYNQFEPVPGDVGATTESALDKPVFYYVLGDSSAGVRYEALEEKAETVTDLLLSGGAYSFANDLIQQQVAAFDRRLQPDRMYLYRYAFVPRIITEGLSAINVEFKNTFEYNNPSRARTNLSLASAIDEDDLDPALGTPAQELASLVEITGPNGEYIAFNTISLSEAQTFAPATRWTNDLYGSSDYSWSLTNGTGAMNADGSYTVTSITAPATLQLTNTVLGHNVSITISD